MNQDPVNPFLEEVLGELFNPRGDGTLRPGDFLYDMLTKGEHLMVGKRLSDGRWESADLLSS
jgi:hypothetical protein